MTAATGKLWTMHLAASVVVLAGIYLWLGIGDANWLQLTATALFGLLLAAFALWVHGVALAHFREPEQPLARAYREALRHLPALATIAIVAVALNLGMGRLLDRTPSKAVMTASWLTLHLRRPIHPALIQTIMTAAIRIVDWFVIPALLLPLAAASAHIGWRGFAPRSLAILRGWAFLAACPVLLLIALWLPWRLIHWTPYQGKLSLEAASFLVRWMVAWLIFVTGLLALSAATGGWLWIKLRAVRPANPIS